MEGNEEETDIKWSEIYDDIFNRIHVCYMYVDEKEWDTREW